MSESKHTPGAWSVVTETFPNASAVLEDCERMLAAGDLHNFTITHVEAPDTLPPPLPPGNGMVCVAYLGNGPTALENGALIAKAPAMHDALKLVLLFHSSIFWDDEKRATWKSVTGNDDATSKALCDHIRKVLG